MSPDTRLRLGERHLAARLPEREAKTGEAEKHHRPSREFEDRADGGMGLGRRPLARAFTGAGNSHSGA
jgi:hypothetical protein